MALPDPSSAAPQLAHLQSIGTPSWLLLAQGTDPEFTEVSDRLSTKFSVTWYPTSA